MTLCGNVNHIRSTVLYQHFLSVPRVPTLARDIMAFRKLCRFLLYFYYEKQSTHILQRKAVFGSTHQIRVPPLPLQFFLPFRVLFTFISACMLLSQMKKSPS